MSQMETEARFLSCHLRSVSHLESALILQLSALDFGLILTLQSRARGQSGVAEDNCSTQIDGWCTVHQVV